MILEKPSPVLDAILERTFSGEYSFFPDSGFFPVLSDMDFNSLTTVFGSANSIFLLVLSDMRLRYSETSFMSKDELIPYTPSEICFKYFSIPDMSGCPVIFVMSERIPLRVPDIADMEFLTNSL